MMKIWGQFVKTGNPNLPLTQEESWNEFLTAQDSMLLKGVDDYELVPGRRLDAMKFWTEYLLPTYPTV